MEQHVHAALERRVPRGPIAQVRLQPPHARIAFALPVRQARVPQRQLLELQRPGHQARRQSPAEESPGARHDDSHPPADSRSAAAFTASARDADHLRVCSR